MAAVNHSSSPFEQSFMFHMIRDFFLLLVLVASVEMGLRYVLLRFDFVSKEQTRVDQAALQLANDVKSIMLNSGGPMAARTVYPILNRSYEDLGLSIAIIPSAVTVESMKQTFKIDVIGLQPVWREGEHLEAAVQLTAEQFCLGCHVKAQVGDVLGTMKVGSYLQRKELVWWSEVKLTAGAMSLKILVHTVLLFFLLRVRMVQLLSLRSTVSRLARGVMDLSPRAKVNAADEFGELAQDLNHFLDRITVVVSDLDQILSRVVEVGSRLGNLNRDVEQQVDGMRDALLNNLDSGPQAQSAQQAAQYRAFAQSLREMALLEAAMQNIAQSGQQVLHRLTHADKPMQ